MFRGRPSKLHVVLSILIFSVVIGCCLIQSFSMQMSTDCTDVKDGHFDQQAVIPKHIHQMFFNETDKEIPTRLEEARVTWQHLHPGFKYTLWNATAVKTLIASRYTELLDVYESYTHWVRRADVARYIVLHAYGGMYVDLDIRSKGVHLDTLYSTFRSTSGVILYVTNPSIVTNDLMISKQHHPFMTHVLCGLRAANHWYGLPYVTTMMSTGPLFLNSRYKSYSTKVDIEILSPDVMSRFVSHIDGASWHQLDGKIIWGIFIHRHRILQCVAYALVCLCCLVIVFIVRRICIFRRRGKLNEVHQR